MALSVEHIRELQHGHELHRVHDSADVIPLTAEAEKYNRITQTIARMQMNLMHEPDSSRLIYRWPREIIEVPYDYTPEIDGEIIPTMQLVNSPTTASKEKLRKLGFSDAEDAPDVQDLVGLSIDGDLLFTMFQKFDDGTEVVMPWLRGDPSDIDYQHIDEVESARRTMVERTWNSAWIISQVLEVDFKTKQMRASRLTDQP